MPNCFHPISGQRLPSFKVEDDAVAEIVRSWEHSLRAYARFRCGSCRLWHLIDEADLEGSLHVNADRSTCAGCMSKLGDQKVIYPSYAVAREAMTRLTAHRGIGSRPYPCPLGNGWHVTTSVKSRRFT